MSDFSIMGDAFQGDRGSQKAFGLDITRQDCSVSFSGQEEIPDSKCNTVSYVNKEAITLKCRNLLAISDTYISYAIKKSMIRVIQTVSTHIDLLKGHEFPILDLKFSPVDRSILCSVDDIPDGALTGIPKIIIWKLNDEATLTHSILSQYAIGATIIQPHPKLSTVWAIVKNGSVGIVTVALGGDGAGGGLIHMRLCHFIEALPLISLIYPFLLMVLYLYYLLWLLQSQSRI
jgi:hypothetical protein